MIIKAYLIMTLLTHVDEIYNITHPRPYPTQTYYALEWDELDFIPEKINNEWVLRVYRESDNELKSYVRKQYWKKRRKFKK